MRRCEAKPRESARAAHRQSVQVLQGADMSKHEMSLEELKRQKLMQKPHVVILGAGASVGGLPPR